MTKETFHFKLVGEPIRVVSTKQIARATIIKEVISEYRELGFPEVVDTDASNPDYLAMLMSTVAAFWSLSRGPITKAWKGPGVYRVGAEFGASQSQGHDKLDDGCITAIKVGELPY